MTNRELLQKAMPLSSLSRKEWNVLLSHLEEVENLCGKKSDTYRVLETIQNNQARMEIIGNYLDYYGDVLDDGIREESYPLIMNL